jgi:hypothetical protein
MPLSSDDDTLSFLSSSLSSFSPLPSYHPGEPPSLLNLSEVFRSIFCQPSPLCHPPHAHVAAPRHHHVMSTLSCQLPTTFASPIGLVSIYSSVDGEFWGHHLPLLPPNQRTRPTTSQHAKVDLKPLIVSVIPIYSLSDTINLFCFLFFILINNLISFSAS